VNLPAKLFLNTQIPASLWFLSRDKANGKYRNRTDEILFIEARELGHLINRRTREFSKDDIAQVAETYHNWRNPDGKYADIPGFCKSALIDVVREKDYILSPGRYVGFTDIDDDYDFQERFTNLQADLAEQIVEGNHLDALILENFKKLEISNE